MTIIIRDPGFRFDRDAYTSAAWLEHERALLFDRNWTMVGDADGLQTPGSFRAVTVGRSPLVLVCGHDGVLRAFHNMCRHRGMTLVTGCGHLERNFACPYHAWRFALDGQLTAVPQRAEQFPDIDIDTLGLLPASVDIWEGMVFANPDPQAAPLAETLGDLPAFIGSYRPSLLTEVANTRFEGAFNWKLFVENHIDVYHLWYLHEETLGDFDHPRFEHHQLGRNWASYEPLRAADGRRPALDRGTTSIVHIDDRDRNGIGAHMVFPNLLMASSAEFFITYAVYPLAPDRTVVDLHVRAEPQADADALVAAARSFIDEDIVACERVQEVMGSDMFAVGALARHHESTITSFHDHLIEILGMP